MEFTIISLNVKKILIVYSNYFEGAEHTNSAVFFFFPPSKKLIIGGCIMQVRNRGTSGKARGQT